MPTVHEQRTRVSDTTVLARYLPPAVASYLAETDSASALASDLDGHVARLQELLQIVISYVPDHVGLSHLADPSSRIDAARCVAGTLLSADLSGFTAFSARLSTLGSEGAEIVAHTISRLFSELFDVLDHWGGSLLKLSGDALTVLFSGPAHERRAVAAALDLQARMADFQQLSTPAGTFALQMRIGVACGDVLLAEVGTPDRVELLVAGTTARQAVKIQRQASPGAVVVDERVYRALSGSQALTIAAGLYRVLASAAPAAPARPAALSWMPRQDALWELHALIARLETLRPYLVDQHLARLATGKPALAGDGDLRPVTVLFAHLADASPLLQRAADGQAAPAAVQTSIQHIWEIVGRYGGTINKIDLHPDGHTLMVLFGAPIAQGRDAERAVSCALALLGEADSAEPKQPLAARRVGIATGRVFAGAVGSPERREYTVMGSVVNLAARLMDFAQPGEALVGASTAAIVQRRFALRELPPVLLKGYDEPVALYKVVAEQRGQLSELQHEPGELIGRQAELSAARRAVGDALAGRGAVVELAGEAGIGKSRLLAEVVQGWLRSPPRAKRPEPTVILVQSQAHSHGRPYTIVADALRSLYDLPAPPEQAAQSIAAHLYEHTPAHARFLPLLLAMLGLPFAENAVTQALKPGERRARLHGLVADLLTSYARSRPLLLAFEDLHWADSASIDLLAELAIAGQALPLALLCTCRPEGQPSWAAQTAVARIGLAGLSAEQSRALLHQRLEGLALPQAVYAAALERTQGNPFFIEETARALHERDGDAQAAPPLPASIQNALLARLDRLPSEERYLLQLASVIGQQVSEDLLSALVRDQEIAVRPTLRQLAAHGLLRMAPEDLGAGGSPEQHSAASYTFAHSLTQETAYESLLFAQRRELHRRAADALRAEDPRLADEEPGLLAYHYGRAEDWPQTLEFSWRAGMRAQSLYAGDLALGHYRQALEAAERIEGVASGRRSAILRRCGDIHALAGRYAEASADFATALAAADDNRERAAILIGWADICEQQAAYAEALALLERAAAATQPDDPLAPRIAVRHGYVLVRQGTLEQARAAIGQCLERLEELRSWPDLLLAYRALFMIALGQSRWSEARAYLRLALSCAERAGDMREIARIYNNLGAILGQEGDLRAAAQAFERAARGLEEIGDQYNLASVKVNNGVIYYKLGDFAAAHEHYETSLRIASAIGALPIESIARNNLGELYRRLGQLPASLDQIMRSIASCQDMNDELGLSEAYRQLAESCIALGRLDEAADACEQARACAIAAGDPQAEAIAYRARGMLAAAQAEYGTAQTALTDSIRLLTDLGSTHELGQSMTIQATILIQAGQAGAARAFLEEAIGLLGQVGAAADLTQAEQLLAATYAPVALEEFQQ